MALLDSQGRNIPFFVDYFMYEHIATADFSPLEDPSYPDTALSHFVEKGFLVRPDTDGLFYGITLYDYLRNINKTTQLPTLTGLVPQAFLGVANTWIECRFVKVYAHNNGTYATTSSYINVGITI